MFIISRNTTSSNTDPVADPTLALRRGPGFVLLAWPAFPHPVISTFFTQNIRRGRGGGGGISATEIQKGNVRTFRHGRITLIMEPFHCVCL